MRRKEKNSHNLHKAFLSQTQEYLNKQIEKKGDPVKITQDLQNFNDMNKYYKWCELHHQNIQMQWYEGKTYVSPKNYSLADTVQVKKQD